MCRIFTIRANALEKAGAGKYTVTSLICPSGKWKVNGMKTGNARRILSALLAAVLVLSMAPGNALRAYAEETGPCEHHTSHNEACGYQEAQAGADCTHEHTSACYTILTTCIHVHEASCYSDGLLPGEGEEKAADACTHTCTEESGCITTALDCGHVHGDDCGYVEANPGHACEYVCEICHPQEGGGAQEQCSCSTLCTEGAMNPECPVCGVEGADPAGCIGVQAAGTPTAPIAAPQFISPQATATIYAKPYYTDPAAGSAQPASADGSIPVVSYTYSDTSLWGENKSWFSYSGTGTIQFEPVFIAPTGISNYGTVAFNANTAPYITYTPSAEVANQTVQFKVKATADDASPVTGDFYWTVHVGSIPDAGASDNATLNTLTYQVGDGTPVPITLEDGKSDYTISLAAADYGKTVTLSGTAADSGATISNLPTTAEYWPNTASLTVTAANKSATQTYTVDFSIPQTNTPATVYVDGVSRWTWDGVNNVVSLGSIYVTPGKSSQLAIDCGGGTKGYGSYYVETVMNNVGNNVGNRIGNQWGINDYPNRYAALSFTLAEGESFTATVYFYREHVNPLPTLNLTPVQTIELTVVAGIPVAEVTVDGTITTFSVDTTYTTPEEALKAAWAYAQGETATVNLLTDVTLEEKAFLDMTAGTNITMTMEDGVTLSGNNQNYLIRVGTGTLTFQSGKIENTSTLSNNSCIMAYNSGTLNITGGELTGNKSGVKAGGNLNGTPTITISGGTIKAIGDSSSAGVWANYDCNLTISGNPVISGEAALWVWEGTVTIDGGTFNGTGAEKTYGVEIGGSKTVTINGGTFTGTTYGAAVNTTGAVNIKGGTFSATGTGETYGIWCQTGTGTVNISSGEFSGSYGFYRWDKKPIVSLSGGTYIGTTESVHNPYGDPVSGLLADDCAYYVGKSATADGMITDQTVLSNNKLTSPNYGTVTISESLASSDTGIQSAAVGNTDGTINGTDITVLLPEGSSLPTAGSDFTITPKDTKATASTPTTEDGGKTWTFTVTAEDGTKEDYTIHVSILPSMDAEAILSGTEGKNGWYVSDVTLTAPEGFQISADGTIWSDAPLTMTGEGINVTQSYYLKRIADGQITNEKTAAAKIDQSKPEFDNLPIMPADISDAAADFLVKATDTVSGVASYRLIVGKSGGGEVFNEPNTTGQFKVTGLTPETNYTWQVYVTDEAGNTRGSAVTHFTTAQSMTAQAEGYTGTYDGQPHGITVTPSLEGATVKYGTAEGTCNQDSLSFTDAGTYTVYYQVTFGSYTPVTGSATVEIAKRPVTVSGITAKDKPYDGTTTADLVYTNAVYDGIVEGDRLTVSAVGTFEDAEMGENKRVTISGLTLGGGDAGNYVLAEDGQQKTATAAITARSATVSVSPDSYEYTGSEIRPTVTVRDGNTVVSETEYTVKYSNNVDVGTAVVTVLDKAGNIIATGSFAITPASLKDAAVTLSQTAYTYDGKSHTPAVTVTKNGRTLKEGVDYTLSYVNSKGTDDRVSRGTVTVIVTAVEGGNYTDSTTASYTIKRARQINLNPFTGDTSHIYLLVGILLLSAAGLIILIMKKRNHRKH